MKKNLFLAAIIGAATLTFTACEPKNVPEPEKPDPADTTAVDPQDTVPEQPTISFPKKHLIEEFTGQDCGYCPYGMDCIHEFLENDTNFILILHHYGYQQDHFSVPGSKTITSALSVSGAPSVAIDRDKTKSDAGKKVVFHPGYMYSVDKSQFETTTYASINLTNTYDPASRELKVNVSGMVAKADAPALQLTVFVKESGMIDYQADYYETYEGWSEFRHANAVRAILTAAKGDVISVEDSLYTAEYSVTLDNAWVPENCMVVACLSEAFKPVVQAEQKPVVEGTPGGDDILHGGITRVPISDYYPEYGPTEGPEDVSGHKSEVMTTAYAGYEYVSSINANMWTFYAYNTSTFKINNVSCVPFSAINIFTSSDQTSLPAGEYEFNLSLEPGSAYAGYRDDETITIEGSMFYFTSYSYLQEGYIVPEAQWLIADGTLTIEKDSWSVVGHARNGAEIRFGGNTAIQNQGKWGAPARKANRKSLSHSPFGFCESIE